MDAGDRADWRGDHDDRPLSRLGRRQAAALRDALTTDRIDALYASPALRARQTLEPIARATGLSIETLPALAEEQQGEGSAILAERAETALLQMRTRGTGRVIAASHGDLIPTLAAQIALTIGGNVARLEHRGQWYRIEVAEAIRSIERLEVSDFPH